MRTTTTNSHRIDATCALSHVLRTPAGAAIIRQICDAQTTTDAIYDRMLRYYGKRPSKGMLEVVETKSYNEGLVWAYVDALAHMVVGESAGTVSHYRASEAIRDEARALNDLDAA